MVCDNDFPANQLAEHVTKQNMANASIVQTRMQMIDSTLKLTDELEKILRRDRSPLAENPYSKNDTTLIERMGLPQLDSEMQRHLTNFSLITHGFGGPAMVAVLNAFKHYLNSMKLNYEKLVPSSSSSSLLSSAESSSSSSTSSSSSNSPSIKLNNSQYCRYQQQQQQHPQQHQQQQQYHQQRQLPNDVISFKVESKD